MSDFFLDYENGNDANTGADWANAWKTITAGPTAARIAPGDRIKIAKSPAPASIGCESGWVAAGSATVTHPTTDMKSGSARVNVTKASYATATLYAYKALAAPLDCSGFDAITGWIYTDAAIADATRWVIDLCSDAAGATPVDSFAVEAIPGSPTSRFIASPALALSARRSSRSRSARVRRRRRTARTSASTTSTSATTSRSCPSSASRALSSRPARGSIRCSRSTGRRCSSTTGPARSPLQDAATRAPPRK